MTESLSHGQGVPRLPESAITPSRIPTLGSSVKLALAVIVLRSLTGSIPMAFPALYARIRKKSETRAINRMMPPQTRYINGEFSSCIRLT